MARTKGLAFHPGPVSPPGGDGSPLQLKNADGGIRTADLHCLKKKIFRYFRPHFNGAYFSKMDIRFCLKFSQSFWWKNDFFGLKGAAVSFFSKKNLGHFFWRTTCLHFRGGGFKKSKNEKKKFRIVLRSDPKWTIWICWEKKIILKLIIKLSITNLPICSKTESLPLGLMLHRLKSRAPGNTQQENCCGSALSRNELKMSQLFTFSTAAKNEIKLN